MGKGCLPIETVTTGSRERLLNEYFRQRVSYKAEEFFFVRTEKKKVEERFCSGDVNCIADWGGKSVKEPLVRTVGSVSSSAVHAFSAPGRDFSFHVSFRTCCNASKSHITLSYTPINTKTFASWRNWLLWKTGIGSRCYRCPFHVEMLHRHAQPGKQCFHWRWTGFPQLSAPAFCTGLCTWVFQIFLTFFSMTSLSHASIYYSQHFQPN